MKCPKCGTDSPEDAKFCGECGAKLEIACPQCGKKNPLGGKFCFDCGQHLSVPPTSPPKDLSSDEKIAKIRKYLPKGVTEKILSQRDKIEGERKQVTVMFCDMKGFTPLSEKLGPEAVYSLMDQVYEILLRKVHDYEGTVNKMTGDGIMALFGAPIALENAPQRAIQSAMAYDGPALIDFHVDPEENVYPMVTPGASLSDVVEEPRREVPRWRQPQQSTP